MMRYIRFLVVIALFFQNSVSAQTLVTNTFQSDSSDTFIDETETPATLTKFSFMNRRSLPQENSDSKRSYVPMIVFGFTGMFLGFWAGHSIQHEEHMPGEIPEVFTKGTIIGAGVGLATGASIGYLLRRKAKKSTNNSSH